MSDVLGRNVKDALSKGYTLDLPVEASGNTEALSYLVRPTRSGLLCGAESTVL